MFLVSSPISCHHSSFLDFSLLGTLVPVSWVIQKEWMGMSQKSPEWRGGEEESQMMQQPDVPTQSEGDRHL